MDDERPGPVPPVPPVPRSLLAAVALIGIEAVVLLALGVFVVVDTLIGDPADLGLALLAAVFALGAGAGLAFAARQLRRLEPAVRSPVVVVQLLALPVGYSLGFQAGRIGYGGPILLCAVAVLFLLFTRPVREVLDREPPGSRPDR